MKKFIVISIVLLMIAGFAITSSAEELVVGRKHIPVGELTVTVEEVGGVDSLVVTYTITDSEWELLETHLYVGITPPTKSAPGRFPYGPEHVYILSPGIYVIPLADFGVTTTLYIAAQAEVRKQEVDPDTGEPMVDPDTGEPIYQEETVWADGTQIRTGKNWAMYFEFPLPEPE